MFKPITYIFYLWHDDDKKNQKSAGTATLPLPVF